MTTIATQPISIARFAAIDTAASSSNTLASPPLRPAAEVTTLHGEVRHSNNKPELREAMPTAASNSASGTKAVKDAFGLQTLLAKLIGMMLEMELGDSKMIAKTSAREYSLAQNQANSLRAAGKAAMAGGISKGAALGLMTFAGAGLQMKGIKGHIGSTNKNFQPSAKLNNGLQTARSGLDEEARKAFGATTAKQTVAHEISGLRYSRLQAKGQVVIQAGNSTGAAVEGVQSNAVQIHNANREVTAGDMSITGRQNELETKTRARNESAKEQMFATLKNTIQNQLDVMSHVAQNTRV